MIQGLLFLLIAVAANGFKGYCGKLTGKTVANESDAVYVYAVRMLITAAISLAAAGATGAFGSISSVRGETLFMALVCGACLAIDVVFWLLCVRGEAYLLVSVAGNVSLVVTLILCRLFYGDEIGIVRWIGVALLVVAGYLMMGYNESLNGKLKVRDKVNLAVMILSGGAYEFLSGKVYAAVGSGDGNAAYQFWTYLFAFAFLAAMVLVLVVFYKPFRFFETAVKMKNAYLPVALLSVLMFVTSFFKAEASVRLPSTALYPLNVGGGLLFSVGVAWFLHEKPDKRCAVGMLLVFASLILINFVPQLLP